MVNEAAQKLKRDVRAIFDERNAKLKLQAKSDFDCFAAIMLGNMNQLHLSYFAPDRRPDSPGVWEAGYYDDDNEQWIYWLVESDGLYALFHYDLTNSLGEKNVSVAESDLRIFWNRYRN